MGIKKYFHSMWIVVAVLSALAQAAPTYINDGRMTWQRGVDGSTWQDWTFDTSASFAIPEQFYNPYGTPSMQLTGSDGDVDFEWDNGIWMGDPVRATITVPNSSVSNPSKTIWFEMVYQAVSKILPSVTAGTGYETERIYYSDQRYSGDWRIMTIGWTISPNPSMETFTFALAGTGGYVSSVSIDTLCAVPAPGAILLAGIGMGIVGMLRNRFR